MKKNPATMCCIYGCYNDHNGYWNLIEGEKHLLCHKHCNEALRRLLKGDEDVVASMSFDALWKERFNLTEV